MLPEVEKKESKDPWYSLVFKSALLVLAFLAVALFISWSFGWVAFEQHDAQELYGKIVNARTEVRRMAASEWARQLSKTEDKPEELATLKPDALQTQTLLSELRAQYLKDPQLASGLALILGFSQTPDAAREGLLSYSRELEKLDSAHESFVYALLSLTRLGELPRDILIYAVQSPEASLRKTGAFALGFSNEEDWARGQLEILLQDSVPDVRWNAAFALARKKVGAARETLKELLNEVEESKAPPEDRFPLYQSAFRAVRELGDEELFGRLKKISMEHSNLKIRQAAKAEVQRKN